MQSQSPEHVESARTAAAVLCLMQGPEAPVRELLQGMASDDELRSIEQLLRSGDRNRRARVLASFLSRLALQLDAWSMR
ncbi:MAG: hypothetical protein ACOC1F_11185 [Myxococcota bacterium]